ncbi:ATP-binding protein [Enterovibrio makurazakiensis]|uniref:histidine kinase n=1 Tax=Enterovibrio gelatinilyticus TaxID=2899819 RepID=A0ABT5R1P3_9GAMM|nr:ATP-binding protein [Enterovibrio sp. ZSDZ42]MDD1793422.1 ATP-binding protein [Enterovibrio sp. ZSDZ42]
MWRIYIESFIGLFFLFIVSLFAFDYFVYQLNPDYDYILEDMQAAALHHVLSTLSEPQGSEFTAQLLANYAESTASTLNIVATDVAPKEVQNYFAQDPPPHPYSFYDDNRALWLTFAHSDTFFHIAPDDTNLVRQKIEFSDSLFFVFTAFGFLIYSSWLIWFIGRRTRALQHVTAEFAKGNLNVRAPTNSGSRVGKMNESFNEMAEKISQLITSNRSLTQAVAHDLRTPIFRIQWQAEILHEEATSPALKQKLASIIEDTEEMEQLVDALLYFAKVGRQDVPINKEDIPAQPFIAHLVERLPNPQNRQIDAKIDHDISFWADKTLLKRAIENVLVNALRYSVSSVIVRCSQHAQIIKITIEDDGPGIPEQFRERLFEPFFSIDPSRNKSNMGHGLGLAIVKLIIEKHDGKATFEEGSTGGAKLVLTIPNHDTDNQ